MVNKKQTEEYFLDQDQSSHWYLVPCNKEQDWNEWVDLDEDDERAWEAPDYAIELGGGPQLIVIEKYRFRK